MTPAALFTDLRPARPSPRRHSRALTLAACLDGPVASLSHLAYRAWTYLRLLPRATSIRHARALLEAHGLAGAIPELEAAGFLVSRAPTGPRAPSAFPAVVPVVVDREALVMAYRPLVETLARRLAKRLPPTVSVDDVASEGYLALLKAAQRYDPTTGVPFGAYARRRITGALLDALRAMDPLSRLHRAAVTAGATPWEEVSLDVARDLPQGSEADSRAIDRAHVRVEAILATLPPVDAAIVRGVLLDEQDVPTVAQAVGLTTRAVRERLAAALETLRAARAVDTVA